MPLPMRPARIQTHNSVACVSASIHLRGVDEHSSDYCPSAAAPACLSLSSIAFQAGVGWLRRLRTKKSISLRWPYLPPAPCPPPGTTSRSKSLLALMSRSTTWSVEDGSTFLSISPITSISLPFNRHALSTFDDSEYCGPMGQPIHCSFHQILSMRLSWQPEFETAAL